MRKFLFGALILNAFVAHAALPNSQEQVIAAEQQVQKISNIEAQVLRKLESAGVAITPELASSILVSAESLAQIKPFVTQVVANDTETAKSASEPAPEYKFGCAQIRGAFIFGTGGQLGVAACYNGTDVYTVKYLTPVVGGFPLTIGAGVAATGGLYYLTSDRPNLTGRFSCSHEGVAYFGGVSFLQCVGNDESGKERSLKFYGLNGGFQAEIALFPIEID